MHACRSKFLQTKRSIVLVQSLARMQANRRKHLQVCIVSSAPDTLVVDCTMRGQSCIGCATHVVHV